MPRESEPRFTTVPVEQQYLELVGDIMQNGCQSTDRTGTGTIKVFGRQLKANLSLGFPLLTTKEVNFRSVKEELLWFISGERNIRPLVLANVHIWDEWPFQEYLNKHSLEEKYPQYTPEWKKEKKVFTGKIKADPEFAEKWGDLGPVYGFQWRHFQKRGGGEIDQLAGAINQINNNPASRRIMVNSWNPEDVDAALLPPCHYNFQFQLSGNTLNCNVNQRSVDTFLGLPFNIASYSLLLCLVAQITDKIPGELTMSLGDVHIYLNHIPQVMQQLLRNPRPLPKLILDPGIVSIDHIRTEQINLENYNPHPAIKAAISV